MKPNQLKAMLAGLMLSGIVVIPSGAMAQFPERPITLIVPWAPGGSTDQTARVLADAAEDILGQSIVVENRPGAATSLGMSEMAAAEPDGYTLGVLATSTYMFPLLNPDSPYDPLEDFSYVSFYGDNLIGIAVREDAPWQTLEELIQAGIDAPGSITYGTGAVGSTQHLAAEGLQLTSGATFVHIPQDGSAGSIPALLGGHVNFISETSVWAPFVDSGEVRVLAVNTEERSEAFPDVPTFGELGFDSMRSIQAIVGPAGIPEDVLATLEDAFRQALTDETFVETMGRLRMSIVDMPGDEVRAVVASETERAAELIEALDLVD